MLQSITVFACCSTVENRSWPQKDQSPVQELLCLVQKLFYVLSFLAGFRGWGSWWHDLSCLRSRTRSLVADHTFVVSQPDVLVSPTFEFLDKPSTWVYWNVEETPSKSQRLCWVLKSLLCVWQSERMGTVSTLKADTITKNTRGLEVRGDLGRSAKIEYWNRCPKWRRQALRNE